MKKKYCIFLSVLLSILTLCFTACDRSNKGVYMNDVFFNEFLIDDSSALKNALTKEYDLNELMVFFENSNQNIAFDIDKTRILYFNEVNHRFPIEIVRSGGYSVYRVIQGGYFYVFWIKPFIKDANQEQIEPEVFYTTYISTPIDPIEFESLTIGKSTAKDVKSIDPYFELTFLYSSGVYSFNYLNDDSVLEIKYTYDNGFNGYKDLVVEEIKIVPRNLVHSKFSVLLSKDIPQG